MTHELRQVPSQFLEKFVVNSKHILTQWFAAAEAWKVTSAKHRPE